MTDIRIEALADREYGVQVREGDTTTTHKVTVPEDLLDDLALGNDDEERLVRESFAFLLDKEPATSILRTFDLDVIERYFPDYRTELRARLAGPAQPPTAL